MALKRINKELQVVICTEIMYSLSVSVHSDVTLIIQPRTWEGTHLPSVVRDLLERICFTGRFVFVMELSCLLGTEVMLQ